MQAEMRKYGLWKEQNCRIGEEIRECDEIREGEREREPDRGY